MALRAISVLSCPPIMSSGTAVRYGASSASKPLKLYRNWDLAGIAAYGSSTRTLFHGLVTRRWPAMVQMTRYFTWLHWFRITSKSKITPQRCLILKPKRSTRSWMSQEYQASQIPFLDTEEIDIDRNSFCDSFPVSRSIDRALSVVRRILESSKRISGRLQGTCLNHFWIPLYWCFGTIFSEI